MAPLFQLLQRQMPPKTTMLLKEYILPLLLKQLKVQAEGCNFKAKIIFANVWELWRAPVTQLLESLVNRTPYYIFQNTLNFRLLEISVFLKPHLQAVSKYIFHTHDMTILGLYVITSSQHPNESDIKSQSVITSFST